MDPHNGRHLLDGQGGVGVIDVRSCNIAAEAVAGISVLTMVKSPGCLSLEPSPCS